MGLEQLNKEELTNILEDKKVILGLLEEKKNEPGASYMTSELVRALSNARCRSCVGRIYEMMRPIPGDPEGKTKKVTMSEGQPYVGGTEMACRTCIPVRKALDGAGVRDVHI
jgi:hypothetical protein